MKDILTIVTPSCPVVIDYGARLAARHKARFTAFLQQPEVDVVGIALHAGGTVLDEQITQEREAASERCHAEVAAMVSPWTDNFRWVAAAGTHHEMMHRGRLADLVLIGQSSGAGMASAHKTVAELLTEAGRPVMVVPADSDPARGQNNVLISWNGSAPATRAIHDALPILVGAETVTILLVSASRPEPGSVPGELLVDHLRQYGIEAKVRVVQDDMRRGIDGVILGEATETGADLIVMGAFGGPRLRDALLGGVTSAVLKQSPVPLLLAC